MNADLQTALKTALSCRSLNRQEIDAALVAEAALLLPVLESGLLTETDAQSIDTLMYAIEIFKDIAFNGAWSADDDTDADEDCW